MHADKVERHQCTFEMLTKDIDWCHHSAAAAPPPPVGSFPLWAPVQETGSCTGWRGRGSGWGDAGWTEPSTGYLWGSTRRCGRSFRSVTASLSMDTCCLLPPQERYAAPGRGGWFKRHGGHLVFLADDGGRNQVCRSGGVSLEPCASARVQAAACWVCDGAGSGRWCGCGEHRQHYPRGPHPSFGKRPLPHWPGTLMNRGRMHAHAFMSSHQILLHLCVSRNLTVLVIISLRRILRLVSATFSMTAPLVAFMVPWLIYPRQRSLTSRTFSPAPAAWCSEKENWYVSLLETWKTQRVAELLVIIWIFMLCF